MSERLRHTQDVRRVLVDGHAARGRHAVIRSSRRADGGAPRWTVSASRRVGSAVDRNRAKRRLRAVMRSTALPKGTDLVVLARASAVSCCFDELVEDVTALVAHVHEAARIQA